MIQVSTTEHRTVAVRSVEVGRPATLRFDGARVRPAALHRKFDPRSGLHFERGVDAKPSNRQSYISPHLLALVTLKSGLFFQSHGLKSLISTAGFVTRLSTQPSRWRGKRFFEIRRAYKINKTQTHNTKTVQKNQRKRSNTIKVKIEENGGV